MSLDYPYYQELKRRRYKAAFWWRLGDILYCVGLFLAIIAIAALPMFIYQGLFGKPAAIGHRAPWWSSLVVSGTMFVFGAATYRLGSFLKGHAYRLGERDGISASAVYAGHSNPSLPEH